MRKGQPGEQPVTQIWAARWHAATWFMPAHPSRSAPSVFQPRKHTAASREQFDAGRSDSALTGLFRFSIPHARRGCRRHCGQACGVEDRGDALGDGVGGGWRGAILAQRSTTGAKHIQMRQCGNARRLSTLFCSEGRVPAQAASSRAAEGATDDSNESPRRGVEGACQSSGTWRSKPSRSLICRPARSGASGGRPTRLDGLAGARPRSNQWRENDEEVHGGRT